MKLQPLQCKPDPLFLMRRGWACWHSYSNKRGEEPTKTTQMYVIMTSSEGSNKSKIYSGCLGKMMICPFITCCTLGCKPFIASFRWIMHDFTWHYAIRVSPTMVKPVNSSDMSPIYRWLTNTSSRVFLFISEWQHDTHNCSTYDTPLWQIKLVDVTKILCRQPSE